MIKQLAVLSVLSFSAATLHAVPINGAFAAFGADSFTSSTITFGAATVQPTISGTFATYLTQGNAINFLPGALPYTPGGTQIAPSGLPAFFTTSEGGETFSFFITSYNATYIPSGTGMVGCASGNTCLLVTGTGNFTGTGVVTYDTSPADFQFDSSYVPGQTLGSVTTFAAQTNATGVAPPPPPVPEPASLALLGTGLLGVVGLARRKFMS